MLISRITYYLQRTCNQIITYILILFYINKSKSCYYNIKVFLLIVFFKINDFFKKFRDFNLYIIKSLFLTNFFKSCFT